MHLIYAHTSQALKKAPHCPLSRCSSTPTILNYVAQNPPYFNNINQEIGKGFFIVRKLTLWLLIWNKTGRNIYFLKTHCKCFDWHKIASYPVFLPYTLILVYVYYKNPPLSLKMFPEITLAEIFTGLAELLSKVWVGQKEIKKSNGVLFFFSPF